MEAWRDESPTAGLGMVVEAIGQRDFADSLLHFFSQTCAAEYVGIFLTDDGKTTECLFSHRMNPAMLAEARFQARVYVAAAVRSGESMISDAIDFGRADRPQVPKRPASELAVFSGGSNGRSVSLAVIGQTPAGIQGADNLKGIGRLLVATARTHLAVDFVSSDKSLAESPKWFECVGEIEAVLLRSRLSRREAEVCARALFGMTVEGISIDLAIGKETATTYRKRAYARLDIGNHHELILWYLQLRREQNMVVNSVRNGPTGWPGTIVALSS